MLPLTRAALLASAVIAFAPPAVRAQGIPVDLVVAATSDVHGRLRAWDYFADTAESTRGLARLATAVDSLRAAHPGRVILLDGGDLLQGNPMTYAASRTPAMPHPVMAAMNTMRYDAAAVGNHEFNYGVPFLEQSVAQARFPFLAANARRPDGSRAFPAFVILERAGVKIGIVGATNPGANIWDRSNLRGRLTVSDIAPAVRIAVDSARAAGAELVVAVLHTGIGGPPSFDTAGVGNENVAGDVARQVPGIDLIIYGHSHREVADTTINGVMLMQPRQWAGSLAVATVRLQNRGASWSVIEKRGELVRARGHEESPAVVQAVAAQHDAARAATTRTIGSTRETWRSDSARTHDTPLVDFVLDVERRVFGADLASASAFDLGATLGPQTITGAQLARLYPYENTLQLVKISGATLRAYLEQSARYFVVRPGAEPTVTTDPDIPGYNFDIVGGAEYVMDLSRPMGNRITSLRVRGRAVAPADSFTLAVNNYRAGGGGGYGMLRGAPVLRDTLVEIRDLLIAEIERRGSIAKADFTDRHWRIEPAAYAAAAYRALHPQRQRAPAPPVAATAAPAASATRASAARPTTLRIISINDFHGALEPRPEGNLGNRGGAAYVAQAIRSAQKECGDRCVTVLIDGGDMFQGTAASNLAFGRPVVQFHNALGFAAGALGNHEFDWGQDSLRARISELRHAVLGANVTYTDGRPVPWIRADTIVVRRGVRIGIVGVASASTPRTTMASKVADLKFAPPAPVIDERVRSLRQRGATVVIVVAHDGAFCNGRGDAQTCNGEVLQITQAITEKVDAMVSGHTHSLLNTTVRGVPVVQARSSGRAIAIVDLPLGPDGAVAGRASAWVRDVNSDSIPADPEIAALVHQATAGIAARVNQTVGHLRAPLLRRGDEYPLGRLIADAQRAAGQADFAVMNNGGIRADVQAGAVTYGALFEVQPFGNVLYRVTVRGDALRAYFERMYDGRRSPRVHMSGITLTWDSAKPAGQRLVGARLTTGAALDDAREYRMVLSDFMLTGGDGLGLGDASRVVEPLNIQDLDALIAYVRGLPGGVITADETPRLYYPRP
ncbi:MAG: 5'-nucleotidase C-terminal domain-containing protein [Gemmatimonadaceae bacterium]|nr:5'-nucleotidase C-terminal domain-containing protein [Gemmatimonadaceae bacterium]